jgi:hypothetical protein
MRYMIQPLRGQGIARAALEGALDQIAHLGGGLVEAISEVTAGRQAQGRFLGLPPAGNIGVHLVSREGVADTITHASVTMLSSFLAGPVPVSPLPVSPARRLR